MVIVLILSKSDDVKVIHYDTDDPREAARNFSEDWLNGKIKWPAPTPVLLTEQSLTPPSPALITPTAPERLAFTIRETAELIGVSYATVHRLLQRGLLKSSQALRTKIIPKREIERFLRETAAT